MCEKLLSKQLLGGPNKINTHKRTSAHTASSALKYTHTHTGALVLTIMEYWRNWWSYFAAIVAAFRSILRSAALQRNSIRRGRGVALMVLATLSTHRHVPIAACQRLAVCNDIPIRRAHRHIYANQYIATPTTAAIWRLALNGIMNLWRLA